MLTGVPKEVKRCRRCSTPSEHLKKRLCRDCRFDIAKKKALEAANTKKSGSTPCYPDYFPREAGWTD